MIEKLRSHLDNLFAALPDTQEVREAKEELYTGMVERYNDYLAEGMDEQEAYDNVIDGIGDLHELFDELKNENDAQGNASYEQGKSAADSIADFVNQVVDFTSGLVSGLFSKDNSGPLGAMELVNTVTLPLENIKNIEVSYISEAIQLFVAPGEDLIVKEYMNRSEEELFANVNISGGSILVRNGRRQGYFGLRSRIEVYLPKAFEGSLSLTTVSGGVRSAEEWTLASFTARTVSGEVDVNSVSAATIRLSSTSGAVKANYLAGNLDLHSVSGSVRVETAVGSGSFKTTSGGVRINFTELHGDVDASSVSGGVRLGLPQGASFEFDGRSVSGGIHTAFDDMLTFQRRNKAHGFVGSAPFYHVRAASTSGGIHVND